MQKTFAFGLTPGIQLDATLHYLTGISTAMEKIDRGVLRGEICDCLEQIFRKIMLEKYFWNDFAKSGHDANRFWIIYSSKKSISHTLCIPIVF